MRIEFLTQDDPLYLLPFFDEFFRHYFWEFEILQVSCSRPMGERSRLQLFREILALYRPAGFLQLVARAGVMRIMGALPRGRDAKRYYTIRQLCRSYGVAYRHIGSPNVAEFFQAARERGADVIVSVACPYILKEALLSLPRLGCINIHHGPLPRYKGVLPTFWQMFHGEEKVGLTVHYMAAKVDEGPALLEEEFAIQPGETLDHLMRRSKRRGAHSMARALHQIASQTHVTTALDQAEGSYFKFPTLGEIREFRRRGLRAI